MTKRGAMQKNLSWTVAWAIFLCLLIGNPAGLWGDAKPKAAIDVNQPIEIDSDRMDAFNAKKMVVFSGNVVAVQGLRTIRAERLTIYYQDGKKSSAGDPVSDDAYRRIERMEANGNVVITEGERTATGNEALFEQEARKVTMTGNAVLKEGENSIKGDRIVVFLEEDRGIVEGGENTRVKATIFPGDKRK
jgi:lipopolysaccharide export system protein LptA